MNRSSLVARESRVCSRTRYTVLKPYCGVHHSALLLERASVLLESSIANDQSLIPTARNRDKRSDSARSSSACTANTADDIRR